MNDKDLTNIDFDNDWKYYYQQSNDKTDKKTIISTANNSNLDQRWSSIQLPHLIDRFGKCWYRKKFDWSPTNQQFEQKVYLNFEPSINHDKKSNINANIWLNNIQIFSGSLASLKHPIELLSKLLHNENILIIYSKTTNLFLHTCLLIYGKVICATGQVTSEEKNLEKQKDSEKNNILDYTVTVDDAVERIDVIFNPKRKSKNLSTSSIHLSQSMYNLNQTNEDKENLDDDDLLVPRLAIVILIVGTRGDVQPFIA